MTPRFARRTRQAAIGLLMIIALIAGARPSHAQAGFGRMAAAVDVAKPYVFLDGTPMLWVGGWAIGEGFTPEKSIFIDGRYVGGAWPVYRSDVCRYYGFGGGAGWFGCDDPGPHFCAAGAPGGAIVANDCVGMSQWINLSIVGPGRHVVQFCASHLPSVDSEPQKACSAPKPFVTAYE